MPAPSWVHLVRGARVEAAAPLHLSLGDLAWLLSPVGLDYGLGPVSGRPL